MRNDGNRLAQHLAKRKRKKPGNFDLLISGALSEGQDRPTSIRDIF